ncbi:FecR family protein [Novosphingobium guangzhouense]|nr:FecR domain-containing protein [Novosphingobium guangzhouense]
MMEDSEMRRQHDELRQEAADWFAIMRGPEAEARRVEFEAWLACNPAHRRFYNRIAETFSHGKLLKGTENERAANDLQADQKTLLLAPAKKWLGAGCIVATVLALGGASLYFQALPTVSKPPADLAHSASTPSNGARTFVTAPNEVKLFQLADGSKLTLDAGSLVEVDLGASSRTLHLVRGHARFDVAHEKRPFVVRAGNGSITARGTIFDVTITRERTVMVHLLRGAVDVSSDFQGRHAKKASVRLAPGQQFGFAAEQGPTPDEKPTRSSIASQWTDGLREYESVRVADLLAEANRHAKIPLQIASSEIGNIRISGMFRVTDPEGLARNVADLLGLGLASSPHARVLVRSCHDYGEVNCRPPS